MSKKKSLNKLGAGILYLVAIFLAAATFLPLIITLLSSFKTNDFAAGDLEIQQLS